MTHSLYCYAIAQINAACQQRYHVAFMRDNYFVLQILKALQNYRIISNFFVDILEQNINKRCIVYLNYKHYHPVFTKIKLVSKPGNFRNITKKQLFKILKRSPETLYFLNTSRGIFAYTSKDIYILKNNKSFTCGFLLFSVELW